jgi:uncharacterized protein YndB with AHSA1/START domain
MTIASEAAPATAPRVLEVSRRFDAPPALVFKAWSSAEHVKHWFCPAIFTVPEAHVEFQVGGRFEVCMQAPDGKRHWTRGRFVELEPARRLVIDMGVPGEDGELLFRAHTTVTFTDTCPGTRMDVRQEYTLFAPIAEMMVRGASMGWEQTLDRLAREVAHMRDGAASARSVVHGSFRIERTYPVPRERVYRALTDPAAKAKWFAGGADYTTLEREMDVRPGGRERLRGRWQGGLVSTFDAVYFDVVPNERLVYSYEMHLDERKISVSLATFELKAEGEGTRLVVTENGAFLDGYDDAGSRERGTNVLVDALGRSLLEE